jgi:hypothetical protein
MVLAFESQFTDYYLDLALYVNKLAKTVSVYDGHYFTALHHFQNVFVRAPLFWRHSNGYHFFWSSRTGDDASAMTGDVDDYGVEVDDEESCILPRLRGYFIPSATWHWADNFKYEIRFTNFAPASAIADFYYTDFLNSFYSPLLVRGPIFRLPSGWPLLRQHIAGLQKLGPVLHMIADACVPQHVRGAMGFRHQEWENYIEGAVRARAIYCDHSLVRNLITSSPFSPWVCVRGSITMPADALVSAVAAKTRERLLSSFGLGLPAWYNAGNDVWDRYFFGGHLHSDGHYLYNLAVAATVHVLIRATLDAVIGHYISPNPGLTHPERLPRELMGIIVPPNMIPARDGDQGDRGLRTGLLGRMEDLLGFPHDADVGAAAVLDRINGLFHVSSVGQLNTREIRGLLKELQKEIVTIYRQRDERDEGAFCPLSSEVRPTDFRMSAEFGWSTYRIPSPEEIASPDGLRRYADEVDVHRLRAELYRQTVALAMAEFDKGRLRRGERRRARTEEAIRRGAAVRDSTAHARRVEVREIRHPEVPGIENAPEPEVPVTWDSLAGREDVQTMPAVTDIEAFLSGRF